MKRNHWLATAAILGAIGVGLGAFGAHIIAGRLEVWFDDAPRRLEIWKTAVQYLMIHAVALLTIVGAAGHESRWLNVVGILFVAGTCLFSGSLMVLAVSHWRFLGMVAPLGGTCLILGWVWAAWGLWTNRSTHP
ncbi:MAG TPA: DUF423 domain-containing protein [Pirellulaceae bacterium]|nr:DUF423 domain-containing protein [Pirellulaceae bacterium]